jgi:hypothetical protein
MCGTVNLHPSPAHVCLRLFSTLQVTGGGRGQIDDGVEDNHDSYFSDASGSKPTSPNSKIPTTLPMSASSSTGPPRPMLKVLNGTNHPAGDTKMSLARCHLAGPHPNGSAAVRFARLMTKSASQVCAEWRR